MTQRSGETDEQALARIAVDPAVTAARTIRTLRPADLHRDVVDVTALVAELDAHSLAVNSGDMSRPEAMLIAQAEVLNAIFHRFVMVASSSTDGLEVIDPMMRIALRAQSQSRATIESLGLLKNPRQVAFVSQANITSGPQQVNNAAPPSRAAEPEIPQNKQLEAAYGERLDPGAAAAPIPVDSRMATVDTLDGAAQCGR